MEHLFNMDCLEFIKSEECQKLTQGRKCIIVTDPPFNIGYHYNSYNDHKKETEYMDFLKQALTQLKTEGIVVVHYPETLYKIAFMLGRIPTRVVSWIYNSNTARQHRDIAFFGVSPNFKQVLQPYKNLTDKRIKQRIADGKLGCKLYDWWNVNQVKNVTKNKIGGGMEHPCVMPLKVMENIVGILPRDALIIDLFMGTGTTGLACQKYGMDFIGCEIDTKYYDIARQRIAPFDSIEKTD